MRGLDDRPTQLLAELGERFERIAVACSFQKEAVGHRRTCVASSLPAGAVLHARHRRALPRDLRDVGALEERLGITVEGRRGISLDEQAALHGDGCGSASPTAAATCARCGRCASALAERDVLDRRPAPRPVRRARRHAAARLGRQARAVEGRTRWPTGPSATCGATSSSTTCPTTRCTTGATPRSAASRARTPGDGARRPLGRHRQDRVRPARRLTFSTVPHGPPGHRLRPGRRRARRPDRHRRRLADDAAAGDRHRHKPVVAVGTDIAYGAITKTLGGWRHFRTGTVDMGLSKWLAFGSVPASVAGVVLVDDIEALHDKGLLWGVARRAAVRRASPSLPARCSCRAAPSASATAVAARRAHKVGAVALGARARLHPRRDLGGQRRARRPRADPRLPADPAPRRRHRRLPRRDPAVGRRHRPRGRRQRRLRADGQHPDRLAARRRGSASAWRAACPPPPCGRRSAASCSAPRWAC